MPELKQLVGENGPIDVVAFDNDSEDWGILSNSAKTPIKMETAFGEKTFPTLEHYFQYMKDPQDEQYLNELLKPNNVSAQDAHTLGMAQFKKTGKEALIKDWRHGGADAAMNAGVSAKLEQHFSAVAPVLVQTEKSLIVADTGKRKNADQDGTWGWLKGGRVNVDMMETPGVPKPGNKLGILLMQKRNEIFDKLGKKDEMGVADPSAFSEEARAIMKSKHGEKSLLDAEFVGKPAKKIETILQTFNITELPVIQFPAPPPRLRKNTPSPQPPPPPPPRPQPDPNKKPTSTLTVGVPSGNNAPAKPVSMSDLDNIAKILAALKAKFPNDGWSKVSYDASGVVLGNKKSNSFTVHQNSMSTSDDTVATAKAMLVAFKAVYPNMTPSIQISNENLRAVWDKACQEMGIAANVTVGKPAVGNTQPQPQPANTQAGAAPLPSPQPVGSPNAGGGQPPSPSGAQEKKGDSPDPSPTGAGALPTEPPIASQMTSKGRR